MSLVAYTQFLFCSPANDTKLSTRFYLITRNVIFFSAPLERLEFRNIVAVKAPAGDVSRWKVEAEWQVYKGFNQPGFYYDISCSLSQSISQVIYYNNTD